MLNVTSNLSKTIIIRKLLSKLSFQLNQYHKKPPTPPPPLHRWQLPLTGLNDDGKYSLEYYVAGTDSCNGDSGGPLYTWKNDVPTLIGVVSRYADDSCVTKVWKDTQ